MLHRSKVPGLLRTLSIMNLIYSVTFTKKNGESRTMSCRGNVGKYVLDNGRPGGAARPSNSYVNVYQMNGKPGANNYRAINLDTIESITTCGITADVNDTLVPVDCSSNNTSNVVKFAS